MLQRDLKLFFKCLKGAGLLLLILGTICIGAVGIMSRGADLGSLISVAVVDNEDSVISRILINSITTGDYLSGMMDARKMDYDNAIKALENGECTAVIVLPDGFVDSIMSGEAASGTVYLSDAAASQAEMIASAVNFGERILAGGQYGIFAGQRLIRAHKLGASYNSDFLAKVNLKLIDEAIYANKNYFSYEELSFESSGVGTAAHLAVCFVTMLLLMVSLFFIPLFMSDCTERMLARLHTFGVGRLRFMMPKLSLMLLFRMIILSITAVLLIIIGIPEISIAVTPATVLSAVLGTAFMTVSTAALTMCFGDGISANIISALLGMFLCGGIVPRQLLPSAVIFLGRITPYGAAKSFIEPLLGAPVDAAGITSAVVYTVLSAALIIRKLDATRSGRDVK